MTTKLKNAYSESTRSFDVIRKCLATHQAKRMLFDYGEDGRVVAIVFALELGGRAFSFRLPARARNVERILYGERPLTEAQEEQAYRTAWANIRDWLVAQLALVDTEMVKAEEVFLPYMLSPQGETYFEALERRQFLLPSGPVTDDEEAA